MSKKLGPISRTVPLALVVGLGACGGERPPEAQLARAELALHRAVATRAPELSAQELERARDGLAAARSAVADEDYVHARRLAEQAELDASLAEARSAAELNRVQLERLQELDGDSSIPPSGGRAAPTP